jgi:hypothetical protein
VFWKRHKEEPPKESSNFVPTLKEYFTYPNLRFGLFSVSEMVFTVIADKQPKIIINYSGGRKSLEYPESIDYSGNGTFREILSASKEIDLSLRTTEESGVVSLWSDKIQLFARSVLPNSNRTISYEQNLNQVEYT